MSSRLRILEISLKGKSCADDVDVSFIVLFYSVLLCPLSLCVDLPAYFFLTQLKKKPILDITSRKGRH